MRHCGIYCPFTGFINIFISVKQKKEHTQTCPTCFRPDFYAPYEFGKNILLFLCEINAQYYIYLLVNDPSIHYILFLQLEITIKRLKCLGLGKI